MLWGNADFYNPKADPKEFFDTLYEAYTAVYVRAARVQTDVAFKMRMARLEIVNTICEGNSFKGKAFEANLRAVTAQEFFHKACVMDGINASFDVIYNYGQEGRAGEINNRLDDIAKAFRLFARAGQKVDFGEGQVYEDDWKARRDGARRRAYDRRGNHPNFPDVVQTPAIDSNGRRSTDSKYYTGEAALKGTSFDQVLGIKISDIPVGDTDAQKLARRKFLLTAYKAKTTKYHADVARGDAANTAHEEATRITAAWRVAQKATGIEGFRSKGKESKL